MQARSMLIARHPVRSSMRKATILMTLGLFACGDADVEGDAHVERTRSHVAAIPPVQPAAPQAAASPGDQPKPGAPGVEPALSLVPTAQLMAVAGAFDCKGVGETECSAKIAAHQAELRARQICRINGQWQRCQPIPPNETRAQSIHRITQLIDTQLRPECEKAGEFTPECIALGEAEMSLEKLAL
jgi:hypothetical protein